MYSRSLAICLPECFFNFTKDKLHRKTAGCLSTYNAYGFVKKRKSGNLLFEVLRTIISSSSIFRPDTLDPALLRPGRLDRKVEFGLPDLESRTQIFKIHTRTMNCERDIRFELLARLCPNSTGNLFS